MPHKPKTPLHEAVYRTVNKSLDSPEWFLVPKGRKGFPKPFPKLTQRLLTLLSEIGYALWDQPDKLRTGNYFVHPLAWEYYQLYGKDYLNQLEAAMRIRPLSPDCPDSDN